jgi:anti-sigma factor RsiW
MKCEQISEWIGEYRDMPGDSPERLAVDLHVAECADCAEEFRLWEESAELIRGLSESDNSEDYVRVPDGVSRQVMTRIYSEQSWYMPAVRRTYAFTFGFRRKVAFTLAALFAVFGCAFLYTAWNRISGGEGNTSGVMETANALATGGDFGHPVTVDVPVASLSDPIVLHVTPLMPEYWVALSMLGMIMTLLILNWFSRVRS